MSATEPFLVLDLPYPVSANRLWEVALVNGTRRLILTKEGKAYKESVAWLCYRNGIRKPVEGRVGIRLTLSPKEPADAAARQRKHGDRWDDDVKCVDLDNAIKATIDGLKGRAFGDDRFVWHIEAIRAAPAAKPGIRVEIWSIPYDEPQSLLDLDHATT